MARGKPKEVHHETVEGCGSVVPREGTSHEPIIQEDTRVLRPKHIQQASGQQAGEEGLDACQRQSLSQVLRIVGYMRLQVSVLQPVVGEKDLRREALEAVHEIDGRGVAPWATKHIIFTS